LAILDDPAEVGVSLVVLTLFGRWVYDQIRGRRVSMKDLSNFCAAKQATCGARMDSCFEVGELRFGSISDCLRAVILLQFKMCEAVGTDCTEIKEALITSGLSTKSKMNRRSTDK